jgi:two-component system sensor histidine kinase YesM
MGKITELKELLSEEIPERAWNIVSGKETIPQSNIYKMIMEVEDII